MVYAVTVRGKLSYKQDISSVDNLLQDQKSTYAIMRYCSEIPTSQYSRTMNLLSCEVDRIQYPKLRGLVKKFIKASGCVMVMDEELETSIYIDPKTGKILTEDQIEFDGDVARIKDGEVLDIMEMDEDGEYDGGAVIQTLKMVMSDDYAGTIIVPPLISSEYNGPMCDGGQFGS